MILLTGKLYLVQLYLESEIKNWLVSDPIVFSQPFFPKGREPTSIIKYTRTGLGCSLSRPKVATLYDKSLHIKSFRNVPKSLFFCLQLDLILVFQKQNFSKRKTTKCRDKRLQNIQICKLGAKWTIKYRVTPSRVLENRKKQEKNKKSSLSCSCLRGDQIIFRVWSPSTSCRAGVLNI